MLLLGKGGQLVNGLVLMGGPMNLDPSNPLGALSLFCGVAILAWLPRSWQRFSWALGGVAAAGPALRNLRYFPPFADGATYAAYAGVPDPAEWAADASFTVLGLSPPAFGLVAAGPSWPRRRSLSLGSAALATTAACWGFEGFNGAWWAFAPFHRCYLLAALSCEVLVGMAVRHLVALATGAPAPVLLRLCLAMMWLENTLPAG